MQYEGRVDPYRDNDMAAEQKGILESVGFVFLAYLWGIMCVCFFYVDIALYVVLFCK